MSERELNIDLFSPLPLPRAHRGESLYGWCARFHQLSCNFSARTTSRQLFGHPSSGLHPDFPSPIVEFQAKSGGQLGTLDELVYNRTLFGFYRPFLPAPRAAILMSAIEIGTYRNVQHALGLVNSLPNISYLKTCRSCMQEDLAHFPVSWWRIEHQWPGMFICQRHQQPLLHAKAFITQLSTKKWILPAHIEEQDAWQEMPPVTPQMFCRMADISEWCRSIASEPGIHLDTSRLRYSYLLEAKERGYVAMDGSLRLGPLRDAFAEWIGLCSSWPGLSFVKEIQDANAGFIGQLVRNYPGIRHPLKHLLMLAYLFPRTDAFFERYKEVSTIHDADGGNGLKRKLSNIRYDLVKLVNEEQRSVNSAAIELGVSVAQATKFLNKTHIPYKHRPRIVGTQKETDLDLALRAGRERVEISRALGIRKGYIKDYLAKHPDTKEQWEKIRRTRLAIRYRANFISLLTANPGTPVKTLKQIPGNGLKWLQHHDRKWLEDNLPILR